MPNDQQMRDEFEEWLNGEHDPWFDGENLIRHNATAKNAAWHVWQAARNTRAAQPCPYVVTSDEGTSHCSLAAKPQPVVVSEDLLEKVRPAVLQATGCGLSDSKKTGHYIPFWCDDPRFDGRLCRDGNPIKSDTCACKEAATACLQAAFAGE